MNSTIKVAGTATAACAACRAVGIGSAVVAGTSLVAIGGAASTWSVAFGALAVPVAGLYFLSRRKAEPNANFQPLVASESCGCRPSRGTASTEDEPIACALGASDYEERVAAIRDLSRRSLRRTSRTPLTLSLTYGPEALDEVRDLVRKEQT